MRVIMTVDITVTVPDGTDVESLTLDLPMERVVIHDEAGPITTGTVDEYCTTMCDEVQTAHNATPRLLRPLR